MNLDSHASSKFSQASVKCTAMYPVNFLWINKLHKVNLPCVFAIVMCSVTIYWTLFEIFSSPFYKTDDTQAYFVDQWEWMHSLNLKALFNNVSTLNKIWAAWPYMLSVSLIRCKNKALKKLYFKSIIKCFKEWKKTSDQIYHTHFPP